MDRYVITIDLRKGVFTMYHYSDVLTKLLDVSIIFRDQACELLEDSRKGTFLVRSTSQQSTLPSGGLHTHSIGVVYVNLEVLYVYNCTCMLYRATTH